MIAVCGQCGLRSLWLEIVDLEPFVFVLPRLEPTFVPSVWCSDQFQSKLQTQGEQMTVPRKDQRPAAMPANDSPTPGAEPFDRQNLGSRLRAAREAKGLTISELADQTRVRVAALEAIEAGDFARLPEPIYVQSYLRAFAQAVGVPVEPILEAFRRGAPSTPAPSAVAVAVSRRTIETKPSAGLSLGGIALGLTALALVAGYLFVSLRSRAVTNPTTVQAPGTQTTTMPDAPSSTDPNTVTQDPNTTDQSSAGTNATDPNAAVGTVNLSVTSTPPGASVLLDGISIGVTPLVNAPVTSGSSRELRVELPGYKASVKAVDLSSNRSYAASLVPEPPAGTPVTPATTGQVTLTFQGPSWVRITDSSGKRLYEGIPAAGTVKNFPGPVSVRAGRPDLIVASIGGQSRGALGTKASPATVRLP
jgi:cytoskeleton protein RodZ